MNPRYPIPDRSNFEPSSFTEDSVMREGDLGASGGVLPDGRPFRMESWWREGYTFITLFFSELDLESAGARRLLALVMPALVEARVPEKHRDLVTESVVSITDVAGHRMYSLTFCAGEPDL